MSVSGRIKQIAEIEGMTISDMERVIGASNGVLSRSIKRGTDIQSKWVVKVLESFPRYSAKWLLTGVGNMFSDSNRIGDNIVANTGCGHIKSTVTPSPDLNQHLLSQIEELKRQISVKDEQISSLIKLLSDK